MFIFLIGLLVIASTAALVVSVRNDGYGTRPGPRSHKDSFPPNSFV
jgi:hypothetical protein